MVPFYSRDRKRRQGTHREKRGISCFIGLSIYALGDDIDRECQHGPGSPINSENIDLGTPGDLISLLFGRTARSFRQG